MLDLNRPKRRPLVRPPVTRGKSIAFARSRGRSDKVGRIATVEVALVRESPSHWTPEASALSCGCKRVAGIGTGQPGGFASGGGVHIRVGGQERHEKLCR